GWVARHRDRGLSAKPCECVVRERADLRPAGQRRGAVGKEGDGREKTVLTRRHAELRRGPEELVPNVRVAVGAGLDVWLELLVESRLIVEHIRVASRPGPRPDGRREGGIGQPRDATLKRVA